ncbi:MAG: LamG-like jellyroll fold domain-containing protein [Blastopirellula sp. JB062]
MRFDRNDRRSHLSRRSGVAVVIVLALLSITLAMSYAMMRTQMTASQIERNLNRAGSARHAALSGLAIGVRKMHSADWQGVDEPINGALSDDESFIVTYETGDPQLREEDPDWNEYPYRVTVRSLGIAFDPLDPNYRSEYSAEAVVQLVRKRRTGSPVHFSSSQAYTTYLWGTQANEIEMPISFNGPTHIQGELRLCQAIPKVERPFYGLIDELAIYDHSVNGVSLLLMALAGNSSNSTVYAHLNGQSPTHWWRFNESSSSATTAAAQAGGITGVYSGGTLPGITVGGSNRAAYFDGQTGRLDLGKFDLPASGRFSIIAWVAPFSGDSDNEYARIISKATDVDSNDHLFMFGFQNGGNDPRLRSRIKVGGSTYTNVASGGSLSTGQWSLVAMTYDGANVRFYKNGLLISTHGVNGAPAADPTVHVAIGDNPPGSPFTRYLGDLLKLKETGYGDFRPFTGDVRLHQPTNSNANWLTLSRTLGLTVDYQDFDLTSPTEINDSASDYQLYPGGKSYTVPSISGSVSNRVYAADMIENPLGVLRLTGSTTLRDNVTIDGLCITPGDNVKLTIAGDQVRLRATRLPALVGETDVWELPVVYGRDDVFIDDAQVTIDGAVLAGDRFEIAEGADDASCVVTGMLHAKRATIGTRDRWDDLDSHWRSRLRQFVSATGGDVDDYFPQWLEEEEGLTLNRQITISPPAEPRKYYWPDLSYPIYLPDIVDEGLIWKYVRRSENGVN